jgi:hypothetical protein
VSRIVNGCVGAQGTAYGSDYINDLLMSQLSGIVGDGSTGVSRAEGIIWEWLEYRGDGLRSGGVLSRLRELTEFGVSGQEWWRDRNRDSAQLVP